MALVYTQVTINGVAKDAVVVEGTGDTQKIILKSSLSTFDQEIFDQIDAATGATFKEKFDAFVLPNGKVAASVYAPLVKTFGEFNLAARLTAAGRVSASEIIDLEDQLAAALAGP